MGGGGGIGNEDSTSVLAGAASSSLLSGTGGVSLYASDFSLVYESSGAKPLLGYKFAPQVTRCCFRLRRNSLRTKKRATMRPTMMMAATIPPMAPPERPLLELFTALVSLFDDPSAPAGPTPEDELAVRLGVLAGGGGNCVGDGVGVAGGWDGGGGELELELEMLLLLLEEVVPGVCGGGGGGMTGGVFAGAGVAVIGTATVTTSVVTMVV